MPPALLTPEAPSSVLLKQWFERQISLLQEERNEEQSQSKLLMSKTAPKVLEKSGLALLGLGVVSIRIGLGAKLLVELERPSAYHTSPVLPPHSFRSGDLAAMVDNGADPSAGADGGVQGVIFRVTEARIILAVGDKRKDRVARDTGKDKRDAKTGEMTRLRTGTEDLELPERIRLVKVTNEATYDRMESALDRVARIVGVDPGTSNRTHKTGDESSDEETVSSSVEASRAATPLILSLFGLCMPSWKPVKMPLHPFNKSLNQSQIDTLEYALASDHFTLIHGPPGTGKTTAIVELIMQIVTTDFGASRDSLPSPNRAVSILVCGASNLAVDNILERLLGNAEHKDVIKKKSIGVTRIGHPARVLSGLYAATLDAQCSSSSEGQLVSDITREINDLMGELKPSPAAPAGNKSAKKAPRLKGVERKSRWEELRALRKEYRRRERQVMRSVLDRAQVVLATCHGAGGRQLAGREFDWVIIDEACQALEASCWIPILKAREGGRLVLAGDHMQLPPTVKAPIRVRQKYGHRKGSTMAKPSESRESTAEPETGDAQNSESGGSEGNEGRPDNIPQSFASLAVTQKALQKTKLRPARSLETTLFSRLLGLYGHGIKSLLSIQYRMTSQIMAFPNRELYESKLEAHASCADIKVGDLSNFIGHSKEEQENGEENELLGPLVFYDTAGCEYFEDTTETSLESSSNKLSRLGSDSKSNVNEVEIVVKHLHILFEHGLTADQITILSPYSAQISLLSSVLKSVTFKSVHDSSVIPGEQIELGTVDSMQGREKDVVLLSLVRSNERGEVGFLAQKKRLNVAMTRAKRQLVIIGDSETIGQAKDASDDFLSNYMQWLDDHAYVESVVATI